MSGSPSVTVGSAKRDAQAVLARARAPQETDAADTGVTIVEPRSRLSMGRSQALKREDAWQRFLGATTAQRPRQQAEVASWEGATERCSHKLIPTIRGRQIPCADVTRGVMDIPGAQGTEGSAVTRSVTGARMIASPFIAPHLGGLAGAAKTRNDSVMTSRGS